MKNIFTALIFLIFACFISAKTLQVPSDFSTIQAAIEEASDGGTILVQPGTYNENPEIKDKSVVLASQFLSSKNRHMQTKYI